MMIQISFRVEFKIVLCRKTCINILAVKVKTIAMVAKEEREKNTFNHTLHYLDRFEVKASYTLVVRSLVSLRMFKVFH